VVRGPVGDGHDDGADRVDGAEDSADDAVCCSSTADVAESVVGGGFR